ncbi:helix-turn-helix domain-containing protein [Trinickia violacea]|uniref:Helix-turn-helix domain-containing protein n=1 Tax=Trinickia violacea TaxID=2571746 RepID=A0A4V1EI69_9BURK|nr:helix-turn-helix domain-containing protein [Trinickia violacea]QCP52730.1 helix-turn-helix domain-containing protein [Trinickia violacea]
MKMSQRVVLMVARIRALMHQQGMSDADLARKTGISPATLSRVLSLATEDPRISTLTAIAEALGTTVGYLLHSERAYPIPILDWSEMLAFVRDSGSVSQRTEWLTVNSPKKPGTFAARTLPSMAPRFREGSIIVVEPSDAYRDFQVAVVAFGNTAPTPRRIVRVGAETYLKPMSSATQEKEAILNDSVTILGVVTESRIFNP